MIDRLLLLLHRRERARDGRKINRWLRRGAMRSRGQNHPAGHLWSPYKPAIINYCLAPSFSNICRDCSVRTFFNVGVYSVWHNKRISWYRYFESYKSINNVQKLQRTYIRNYFSYNSAYMTLRWQNYLSNFVVLLHWGINRLMGEDDLTENQFYCTRKLYIAYNAVITATYWFLFS